jgi:hypothetical protein
LTLERVGTSPDEFLSSLPDDIRPTLVELDAIVRSCLPGRSRSVWEGIFWGGTEQRILGYGDVVQPRPRGDPVEWFLVGSARQRRHYSVCVNAVDEGGYLLSRFADRLGKVKIGSASIGFGTLEDLDLSSFRKLLERAHELTPPDVPTREKER